MIKGETVVLINKTEIGSDPFGNPLYEETEIEVNNVILGNPSFDAAVSDLQMFGKKLAYVLAIPKGDTNNWQDTDVIIRGSRFRTYGFPLTQTSENVPGRWNTQVKVERYE